MFVGLAGSTATSADLSFSDVPAGTLLVEIQLAYRSDFQWCLAPIFRTTNLNVTTVSALNQAARYFVRARPVSTGGIEGDWSPTLGISTPATALRNLAPQPVMIEPALIVPAEPVLDWPDSNEIGGHPARALGRDDPQSTWWANRAGANFAFNARMSGAPIDTIAVLESNASESSTIRVKADGSFAGLVGSSPAFSTAFAPFRASAGLPGRKAYHSLVRLPAPQRYEYWRVEIGGPVPGEVFAATYAVFGLAHSSRNFASDSKSETVLDAGSVERDRSGNPTRVAGHRGRTVEFEIQNMTEAQYEGAFEQIRWLTGTTDPALVVPNSKPGVFLHDRILYGLLGPGRATNTYSPRFTQGFSVSSLI